MDATELQQINWSKIALGYIPLAIGVFLIAFEVYTVLSAISNPVPKSIPTVFVLIGWITLRYS